jgi:hypothetical protein
MRHASCQSIWLSHLNHTTFGFINSPETLYFLLPDAKFPPESIISDNFWTLNSWTENFKGQLRQNRPNIALHHWTSIEIVITCKRGIAKHSVMDDSAFLWELAILRHPPNKNPRPIDMNMKFGRFYDIDENSK